VLLCISVAAALLISELVLRLVLPRGYYVWPPHLKTVFKPYPGVMPGVSGDSLFMTNSRGIRGDEPTPEDSYRILAVGGSTTECLYLDQSETWPSLLQNTLNENDPNHHVWVGNAGMSAITTRHHIMAMKYLPLREMKIDAIILLVGINDFTERLAQEDRYDPNFLAESEAEEILLAQTFTGGYFLNPTDPFFKRTAIYQVLRKIKRRLFPKAVEDAVGKIYFKWREHRRNAKEIRNELPDLSSALEEYEANLNKIIDMAKEKSVRLILMTQPTMWKPGLSDDLKALLWFGGTGDYQEESGKAYYSVEALELGMERYNETLLGVCRARRVECIDLSPMLEKDTTVFFDDVHFNESGARKVSRAVSDYILSHSPFGGSIGNGDRL
jgi:lysophospholipase L1-like esterase